MKITKINPVIKEEEKINVAAYCRVSTSSLDQLESLENQKTHYKDYISNNKKWRFVGVYYDEGVSGTKVEKRRDLIRLINDCKKGKVDFIITKSISRFSRNTLDCLEIVRKLNDAGVNILFEKENIDTSTMESELFLGILSSLAENESYSISQNIKWGINNQFRNGTYKVANVPYGYVNKRERYSVDKKKAEIVKRVFKEYLGGKGAYTIAKELLLEEVPTAKGGEWKDSTVLSMLKNENYTGSLTLGKTFTKDNYERKTNNGEKNKYLIENHHEAIISKEDFDKVQETIKKRALERKIVSADTRYRKRYAMTRKIFCPLCGASFKRNRSGCPGTYRVVWNCTNHQKGQCDIGTFRDEDMKIAFIKAIKSIKSFELKLGKLDSKIQLKIKSIDEALDEIKDKQSNLTKILSNRIITGAQYREKCNELKVEIDKLNKEKNYELECIKGWNEKYLGISRIKKCLDSKETIKYSEELFEDLIEKVEVIDNFKVKFIFKCGISKEQRIIKVDGRKVKCQK